MSAVSLPGASLVGDGRTIAGLATSSGRSALAIVRVSGREVGAIAQTVLDPMPGSARRATHCRARDVTGATVDDVIATLYRAPHSFTGEDMLEVSTHGGHVAPAAVLEAVIAAGARQAEPGEFTRRAVLNGKMDLLQAEAIGDLIDARSRAAHRLALRQLDGGLSERIVELRQRALDLEAMLAYDVDFPDEDDGPISRERIMEAGRSLEDALRTLLATSIPGTLVHEGALVVLAGRPNAGKSSLFNALLGESRALVTPVPGTTRDAIEAVLDLPGWPLRLVDTAGLHDSIDPVERLGMEVSSRYLGNAALVLACADTPGDHATLRQELEGMTGAPVLAVRTKADLVSRDADLESGENEGAAEVAVVSALKGTGLERLLERIQGVLSSTRGIPNLDAPALTSARHRRAVEAACRELACFVDSWERGSLPATVAATHVRSASDALGELIGTVRVEDVLGAVFSRFCVGK